MYLDLDFDEGVGPVSVDVGLKQIMFEIDGAYAIDENQYLSLLAGVRYTYLDNSLDLSPPTVSLDSDKGWFDPVIGALLKVPLSERWSILSRLDFAGLRPNSHSWQLMAGTQFQATELMTLNVAYRVLNQDYERSDFHYDAQMEGLFLGVGFHW